MPNNLIDITGKKINNLLVLKRLPNKGSKTMWLCRCDCGEEICVWGGHLRGNYRTTKSCRKCLYKRLTKHGGHSTKEYKTWQDMKSRCLNSNKQQYKDYGGRGIIVCQRWLNSFSLFLEDMGLAPSQKHTIERIDVNGNYEPSNCKWIPRKEQNRNQRTNVVIEYMGKKMILVEWSEFLGIRYGVLLGRIRSGWTIEDAFTRPVRKIINKA